MEPIVCFAKCSGVAQNVRVIVQQYENDSPMLERVLFHALEYLAASVYMKLKITGARASP